MKRFAAFFGGVFFAVALGHAPALAQADAEWHRVEVQQGVLSVETPCAPDELRRIDRLDSPGIQCRIGEGGFGALLTHNGLTPDSGDDTFDGVFVELKEDEATGEIETLQVAGKRAFRATNAENGRFIIQIVELGERELLVMMFVGDPMVEEALSDDAGRYARAVEYFETLEFVE